MKLLRKRYSTLSLKWKVLYRLLIALIMLFILVGISQHFSMRSYLLKTEVQLLQSKLHSIDTKPSKHNDNDNDDRLDDGGYTKLLSKLIDNSVGGAVINSNGTVIYKQSNTSREYKHEVPILSTDQYKKIIAEDINPKHYTVLKDSEGYKHTVIWTKIINQNSEMVLLQLDTPMDPINLILYQQMFMFIVIGIAAVAIFMVLGNSIFKHSLTPLYTMTDTVEKIDVGELSLRLSDKTHIKETDKLSSSFNSMLERLEISFENERVIKEKMKKFIGDASHELRTPLTSIHGFVEVLLRGAAKNEQQLNMALNSILNESDRLTDLVNNLLLLTRLDGDVKYEMKEESLQNIVDEIKPQLEVMAGKRQLLFELGEVCTILANKNQFKQIIFNLVHNAVQHTEEGSGKIQLEVNKLSSSLVELRISDNGSGISPDDIDNIFDRFYRSENHRSRKTGGYGLGLSIVKSIVDAHHGSIEVNSTLGEGTTFILKFKCC